jgi:hypothetical protein
MEGILTKTNKTFAKIDQNLADLKNEFENKYNQAAKLQNDPDNPEYQQLKSELRNIQNKRYILLRG